VCCPPNASAAGTFTVELADPEHPLGHAAGISGKVLIKGGPRDIDLSVECLGLGPEGRLEGAGAGFKIGEGSYFANLNYKPRITALSLDKKTGIITHWHSHRAPGWYLVFLEGPAQKKQEGVEMSITHEGCYDWKWVELTGPTAQVTADLTVDPAALGAVAVAVTGAPAAKPSAPAGTGENGG
jgi:hypothetical protein